LNTFLKKNYIAVVSMRNVQAIIKDLERTSIDWQSVNRQVAENKDFKEFIDLVSDYHQTGKIHKALWNR